MTASTAESTSRSDLYARLLAEKDPEIRVFGKACPLLVPLVEEGWTDDPVTEAVAVRYLADLLREDIDTLVMGTAFFRADDPQAVADMLHAL